MIRSRRWRSHLGVFLAGGFAVSLVGLAAAPQPPVQRWFAGQVAPDNAEARAVSVSIETQASAVMSDEQIKDLLIGLEKEFYRALRDRDEETVRRMMGPDGIYVNSSGMPLDPQQVVDRIFAATFDPIIEGRVVLRRVTPDVAVIMCDFKWSPTFPTYQNTGVYVKRGDTWVSPYHHISNPRVPSGAQAR